MMVPGALKANKIKLNKDLTLEELKKHKRKKVFFIKNCNFLFPIFIGGTLVALSGSELYVGETNPVLDEVSITKLIKLLGKDGWYCVILQ